jgi:hypothetical protein
MRMGLKRFTACVCALVVGVAGADLGSAEAATRAKTRAPREQLSVERKTDVGSGTVYRYKQRVGGYDVLGAEAIVNVLGEPGQSKERLVLDSTWAKLREPKPSTVSKSKAIRIARDAAKITAERDATKARLAMLPKGAGKLVWEVQVPALEPLGDFEVLVDAHSGRVLRKLDLLKNLQTGDAMIYDPNPPVMQGDFTGLADHGNADYPQLTNLRTPVVLQRIADGQSCLSGQFAAVKVVKKHRKKRVCRSDLDWSWVTRASRYFEALMAYFHIDRIQAYIQQDLGILDASNRQQVVIANAFKADNAFYSPMTRRIELGKGGVDDGEDADVIVHEYGHAIQDAMIRGYGISFDSAAMGEGFGDYLAAAASAEFAPPPLTPPSYDPHACIADWDAVSYTFGEPHCLRRADRPETLAEHRTFCGKSFHCLGQVWSSALYHLREIDGLGQDMDAIAIRANSFMGRSPSFSEAANALLLADANLNGSANQAAILAEMQSRGFL